MCKLCKNGGWNIPNMEIFLGTNYVKMVVTVLEKGGKSVAMVRYM